MAGEKTTGTSVVKRLLRWLVRIGVVLVIAGLLFYIVVLPSLVERVAISTLEAMGLPDVKLELRGLSIRHAQLANLAAGEGDRLFVGGIGLRYSVLELLRGEVEAIELTGVEVDVRIRDGVLDLGPIDDYLAQESTTEGFPVGRIDLRSSTIALDIEGTSLRLPLRGIAAKWSDGRVGVSVWVGGSDLDVHMEGAFDPDSFDADISTHIEWRDAGALVKALLSHVAPALHLGGSAEIDITCRRQDGNTDIGAEGCIRDVTIGQGRDHAVVTADELTIEAGARFEGADVDEVDVDVEIHGVRAAAFPSPLAGTLRFNWPRPKTAHGLAAHFDRLEGTLLSANVRGSDCSVWLDVSAPSLTAWWNGESDAEIELAVYGRLGKVLRRLAPAFIDEFGEPGKLSLKGRAAARLTRTDGAITSWRLETSDSRLTLEQGAGVPTQILSGVTADLSFAIEANPNEAALSVKSLSPIGFHAPVFDLGIAQVAFEGADRPAIQIPFGGTAAVRFGETIDWDAHAKLSLWAKGGRFRAPDGTLSGLDADVSLSLDATPERVRASIGSGTQLRVGSVRLDSGAFDIQPVGYEAPLLTAKLAGAAAVVSADLATLAWTLSATDVALSMPEAVVTCVEPRVKADGLALAAKLNLAVAPGKLEATIQPGAELVLKSLATDAIRIEQDKSTPLIRLASEEKQGTLAVTLVEQELSWRADLPEVALDLAAESVSLPDGPTVRKPTLSLRFGAAAVQDKLSLTLQDGSCVVIDRAEALIGEDILRLDAARFALQAHAEHPLVELRLDTAPREIRIALPVRAESPIKVALGTRARGAATSVGALFLVGVDGRSADVKASLSIAGADVAAQHKVGSDMLKVDIDDWSLQADVSGKGPIDALPLEATFALTSSGKSKALTASMGDIAASLGKVELKGEGRLSPKGKHKGNATLTVAGGEASHKGAGIAVKGIAATVPLLLGETREAKGAFACDAIHVADAALPGLKGTFDSADRQTRLAGTWPLFKGAALKFDAALDLSKPLPKGEFNAALPRFTFDDSNQPSALFGVLEGVDVSGAVSADARVRLAGGLLDPLIKLKLEDVSISSEAYDAGLEGITTELTFDSLTPLATPSSQRIRMRRGHVGKLDVHDGAIAFRLEDVDSLFVEQLEWGWAGGRLYTYALRLNPLDPKPDFVLYADGLELKQLLALVAEGHVTGAGSLYGRLPIHIDWPTIDYGRGFLYATPGVGRLTFSRATLDSYLDLGHPMLTDIAAQSLEEFEYSQFQVDFMGEDAGKLAKVRVLGKSLSAKHPWPWLLDVPIHGFDRLLNQAIIMKRAIDR